MPAKQFVRRVAFFVGFMEFLSGLLLCFVGFLARFGRNSFCLFGPNMQTLRFSGLFSFFFEAFPTFFMCIISTDFDIIYVDNFGHRLRDFFPLFFPIWSSVQKCAFNCDSFPFFLPRTCAALYPWKGTLKTVKKNIYIQQSTKNDEIKSKQKYKNKI